MKKHLISNSCLTESRKKAYFLIFKKNEVGFSAKIMP